MTVINEENREKKVNFDEKGKFCKGNTISRGKRNRSQTDKLITALKRAGKTVVNKLVPTISELTGAGGEPLSITLREIIYGKDEEEGKEGESGEAKT